MDEEETMTQTVAEEPKETVLLDGREVRMKPSISETVNRLPRLKVRPKGMFQHPNDWTEEEINFIVDSLKNNVPLYVIANFVHCERHTLSKLIESMPELKRLKEDQPANLYEEAVFQADRLAKAGNASIVMFILERLGKNKGWSQQEMAEDKGGDEGRIVMGIIPDEEVAAAQKKIEETQATMPPLDPMALQRQEDEKRAAAAAEAERIKNAKPVEEVTVGPAMPSSGEDFGMGYGGYGGGYGDDPYASGADSPFMN